MSLQHPTSPPTSNGYTGIYYFSLITLMIAMVIGPLWAGSYHEGWHGYLIPCTILAISTGVILPRPPGKPRNYYTAWVLGISIVYLAAQGLWMWYNSWGLFARDPSAKDAHDLWSISLLDNQPYPDLPGSTDRAEAWDRLRSILPCLGLVWITRSLLIHRANSIRFIFHAIFWTGVAVAALGLVQRWTGAESTYWHEALKFPGRTLFFGTFRSPGIASAYLNLALALGLSILISPRSGKRRDQADNNSGNSKHLALMLSVLIGNICLACGAITAGSKAGMVFALLTILLWLAFNGRVILEKFRNSSQFFSGHRHIERNILAVVTVLILSFLVLSFAGTVITRWEQAQEGNFTTLEFRKIANDVQIKMMQDEEWGALGFGPGSFYPLFPYYTGDQGAKIKGVWVYAHNDHLQTLVEWGWVGASVFVLLIGGGAWLLLREVVFHKPQHSKNNIIQMRGCIIAIVIMLLHAVVDFPFQIESIAVTFAVILGIAWAAKELRTPPRKRRKKKMRQVDQTTG